MIIDGYLTDWNQLNKPLATQRLTFALLILDTTTDTTQ